MHKIHTNADTFYTCVAPHLTSMPNKGKKTMLSIKIPELYKAIFRAGKKRNKVSKKTQTLEKKVFTYAIEMKSY